MCSSDLQVETFLFQERLPVDVRHNAKIHRLALAKHWTARLRPWHGLTR